MIAGQFKGKLDPHKYSVTLSGVPGLQLGVLPVDVTARLPLPD